MDAGNLKKIAFDNNFQPDSVEFASWMDSNDSLLPFCSKFIYPTRESLQKVANVDFENKLVEQNQGVIYLCGNSLGLQPIELKGKLISVLDQWGTLGVHAYRHGVLPASGCDIEISRDVAKWIVGAKDDEVAITNNLSINMHLLLATFYRPHGKKNIILLEYGAFPTDYYAVESQISWHGLQPTECIVEAKPRDGEWCIQQDDLIELIKKYGDRIALIWLPGIQYVTGQLFDIEKITAAGHEFANCPVGWDLAHSVGNVPLYLHKWNVDMAVWCSYKYLNASPGAVGGLFVHERHHHREAVHGPPVAKFGEINNAPQLTGWWSHRVETRFQMTGKMELARGAAAYRVSNPSLLLAASLRVSLDIFKECGGMEVLREKSVKLTGYLHYLLTESSIALPAGRFSIVTPADPAERGAQLTVFVKTDLSRLFEKLTKCGFLCDTRGTNFLRCAPVPLYNRFMDVYLFAKVLYQLATS